MKITRSSRLRALPLLLALVGTGSALTFAFSPFAPAARAQAGGLPSTVGVIDEDKLADGYKEYQNAVGALDKRAQDLDSKIPAREYLSDSEGVQFDTVIVLPTLASAQTSQLNALVKVGTDRKAEYIGLIGKADRTPADNKRLQELQAMSAKNGPNLQKLSQNLLEAIRAEQDKTDKFYTDKANSVVITIAGEKKLVAVLRKKALVWSADNIDITNDVLTRLNPK